ncbi:hypothetical protein Pelo_18475 [Pelomyxa schiedti]|nr:hypothetical protein Pelo_18475 [Pelomyxa schiedti]
MNSAGFVADRSWCGLCREFEFELESFICATSAILSSVHSCTQDGFPICHSLRWIDWGQPLSGFGSSTGLLTHPTQVFMYSHREETPIPQNVASIQCCWFLHICTGSAGPLVLNAIAKNYVQNTESFVLLALCFTTSFLSIIAVDDALHVGFIFSAPLAQYHYSRCLAAHLRSLQPEAVPGLDCDVSAAYYTELCFSAGLYDVPNNSESFEVVCIATLRSTTQCWALSLAQTP